MSERMDLFATISEILAQYTFGAERCMSPGKFEGEPISTIFYYNAACNGDAEPIEAGGYVYSVMDISEVERGVFGVPSEKQFVAIWDTDTGFANAAYLSQFEYDKLCREAESETAED